MMRYARVTITLLAWGFGCCVLGYAGSSSGSSGTIRGSVVDPSGAAVKGAVVEIQNPVSRYRSSTATDSQGNFVFENLPFNNYHLSVSSSGFQVSVEDVSVRTVVPAEVKIDLRLGESKVTVDVEGSQDLLETIPTTHTDVDRGLFDRLPLESQSSSLSSLVTASVPGIAADSNGLFHGLGDHAQNSFSVDDQPITDQQSKVFSNQIPLDSVQSMEVIEGAPPAEYGDKTSVVIVVTTRSGLGVTQPHGEVDANYGSFGTAGGGFNLAYGGNCVGQLYLRQWPAERPVSGWTGVHRDARPRQRREFLRSGGLQAFPVGHSQSELRLHPFVVSDAEFVRRPKRNRLVRAGSR